MYIHTHIHTYTIFQNVKRKITWKKFKIGKYDNVSERVTITLLSKVANLEKIIMIRSAPKLLDFLHRNLLPYPG